MIRPLLPLAALAIAAPASAQIPISAELTLPVIPTMLARADGAQIAYEIRVASFHRSPMRVRTLEILDGDGRPLGRYEGDRLAALIGGQWVAEDADRTLIPPAGLALIFVNQPVAGPVAAVRHRLTYTVGDRPPVTVESAPHAVAAAPQLFGPPLRGGGPWSAVYEPSMEFGHRRYVYAVNGTPRIPGRFAVDFFHADRNPKEPRYAADPGYGAEVIAVADGTVVAARNDFADPEQRDPNPVDPENATGNYVALDIGPNESGGRRIVFYEHLKQGLAVKQGDRVRRGQLLGSVGATGQVGGTHLHFHVADTNSPLGAEGLPFAFDGFEQVGSWKTIDQAFSGERWQPATPRRLAATMPAPNVVVRFP